MVNFGQAAVGIILLLIVVGGLLYLFYSRTNAVEKTGYASLTMLALVSLLIPVFWITEAGNQAAAQGQQETTAIKRGMMLYAQICTDKCYAIKDGKVSNAKYNGYSIDELNTLGDDELRRVISAGVYNPAVAPPTNSNAIARSDQYGGQLQANDVDYLFAFLRSADPGYLRKQGFSGAATQNGFKDLPSYLQSNSPALYDAAVSLGNAGQFGQPVDMTNQKAVTISMVQPPAGASCMPSCYDPLHAKVKVGTVITWVNKTNVGHTVSAIVGQNTAKPQVAPQIFDSGLDKLIPPNGTFKYTITDAAYTFNPDHTVIYYCQVHPMMLAELTIVK